MTERGTTVFAPRNRYAVDLAISAATFDADLVADLRARLAPRLRTPPVWEGHVGPLALDVRDALLADSSCVVLVLHHRLWQDNTPTRDDASVLCERLRQRPDSVCVITLDDTKVPEWLAAARQCDLAQSGVEQAAAFALDAIESCGGSLRTAPTPVSAVEPPSRWSGGPSFLVGPRAQSVLRREFDAVAADLKTYLATRQSAQPGGTFELHVLPFRLIARIDDRGISVSWIIGRSPTVDDGRLLVIEWANVASERRGIAALKSARACRELIYRVEGSSGEDWRWRVDRPNGRAYATSHLVAEWLASASIEAVA